MGSQVEVGTILADKYRVERTIGSGGMGVVVEAVDIRLERRVAIKFLLPEYAEHGEAASRFMREARAAVKIKSDHSARVIDVGTLDSGSPYMVMEYLEGADLSQIIERDGVLSVEDAALYIIQACEAVAEAHAHGIVHRDLKPANLFLANQPDGSVRIKVLDFGISKVVDSHADHSLTRTSSMMGSPLYMSPEQMRSTRNVDLRTDIWALGVIFYEMVTGSLPFVASSVPELSAKVLLEEPEALSARRPDLPLALERIVARALCKKPAERFPSIAEFAMELLPFAPQRARHNVERITKVLHAAGLSTSRYRASERPAGLRTGAGPSSFDQTRPGHEAREADTISPVRPIVVESETLPEATQVNFGQTSGPRRGSRKGRLALVALGSVLLLGGAVFMLSRPGSEASTTAAGAGSLGAEVAPPLKKAEAPSTPNVRIEPPAAPAAARAEVSGAASVPLNLKEPVVEPESEAAVAAKVQRPTAVQAKPRASKASLVKKSSGSPDPFGEFGGRK